jgi:hypothetical protein
MRGFFFTVFLTASAGLLFALDLKSGEFIDYMHNLNTPSTPHVFDDAVIFTMPSSYKRVGIAFANENFAKIHWFLKLLVPIDNTAEFDPKSKIPPEMLRDSGILFYAYTPSAPTEKIEYRLIIDGLWSADPLNKNRRTDPSTGLDLSIAPVPQIAGVSNGENAKTLFLTYKAGPDEIITVAGDFNGWDPFMYQMEEKSSGVYKISIPLPAGTWRYVFFHRGKRVLDPNNLDRVYSKSGMMANTIVLK